jgi:hypothetical protein
MQPERSTRSRRRPQRRGRRRWLPVGGVVLAAILAGGVFALLVSGRDDARPLAAEASPTPTPTVQTPSPAASPSASPSPSATAAQTPEPTATPPPTSDGGAWIGPERIATRDYGELALVVDDHGIAHAAAELDNAIYYLTSASGSWTREPLTMPPAGGHDAGPSIAIDHEGSLAVVFMRYRSWRCDDETACYPGDPDGLHVVSNASGSWSDPGRVPVELHTALPSKAVSVRDGALHIAYDLHAGDGRDRASVWYATNRSGAWTTHHVADDSTPLDGRGIQVPLDPSLALAADGTPRIAFGASDDRLHYAAATGAGGFTVESVRDVTWGGGNRRPPTTLLTLDSLDRPHIVYIDGDGASRYVNRSGDDWSSPELTFPDTPAGRCGWWTPNAIGMVVSQRGTVHIASRHTTIFSGLWFATNRSGHFETHRIWFPETENDLCDGAIDADPSRPTAIAGDSAGRPHILFTTGWGDATELWYAIGPGD